MATKIAMKKKTATKAVAKKLTPKGKVVAKKLSNKLNAKTGLKAKSANC